MMMDYDRVAVCTGLEGNRCDCLMREMLDEYARLKVYAESWKRSEANRI